MLVLISPLANGFKKLKTKLTSSRFIRIGFSVLVVIAITLFGIRSVVNRSKSKPLITIWINETPLRVEVKDTPSGWSRGLMYRNALPKNQGMLFIFENSDFHSFWMKNTYIPLSIAFVSASKEIVQIDSMFPLDTVTSHFPKEPIKYAIEVNQGWFRQHKIKVGDRVRIE